MPKTLTLRLSDEQVADVELIARIKNRSVSALIRLALDHYTDACRNDPDFQHRLDATWHAQQRATARLAGPQDGSGDD
ncbi:MAG: hypothetical protein JWQ48_208 [Conexibacter sp.]|nr:hypothetical protein [Conexibacter sp.]